MRGYIRTTELAEITDCSRQWLYKQIETENWQSILERGAKWVRIKSLPADLRHKVKAYRRGVVISPETSEITERAPEWKRRQASDRFRILTLLTDAFRHPDNIDRPKLEVIKNFALDYNAGLVEPDILSRQGSKSERTLQRWLDAWKKSGTDNPVDALSPAYGKRRGETILAESDRDFLKSGYLQPRSQVNGQLFDIGQNQLSVSDIYDHYAAWKLSLAADGQDATMASYDTVRRFLSGITFAERVAYRQGEKAFKDNVNQHAIRDYTTIKPNSIWTSDGHDMNLFARNAKGDIIRPVLVTIMDMRSRRIMGFDIQETESSQTVINAMTDAILSNGCVVPDRFYIDNGRAFKNKVTMGKTRGQMRPGRAVNRDEDNEAEIMKGLYAELGIKVSFALPYNSAAKGTIERSWRTINDRFTRHYPTYTGKDPMDKPEILKARIKDPDSVITLEQLRIEFRQWVQMKYNLRQHAGQGMGGESPDTVYFSVDTFRRVTEAQVAMATLRKEYRKVSNEGVMYQKWMYSDVEGNYKLYLGEQVIIAVKPSDITSIYVLDKDGAFLFKAGRRVPISMDAPNQTSLDQIRERKRINKQIGKLEDKKQGLLVVNRMEDVTLEAEAWKEQEQLRAEETPRQKLSFLLGED